MVENMRKIAPILLCFVFVGCTSPGGIHADRPPAGLERILQEGRSAERVADPLRIEEAYRRGVEQFPEHAAAWVHYAEFHRFWKNEPGTAEQLFQRGLNARYCDDISTAFAWRGLGEIARGRGDVDAAIRFFEKSLAVRPLVDTHRSLSALYANEKQDFEKAAEHSRSALAFSPDDPIAILQYAVQMVRLNRPEEARRFFEKGIRLGGCDERGRSEGPVHCCVLYNGACYHAVNGEPGKALAMLEAFFTTPNHRHISREEIRHDPDFQTLLADPTFQSLLDRFLPGDQTAGSR